MSTFRLISKGRLAIMLSLALMLSAFVATPAFADGETPPAPDEGTTETTDGNEGEGTQPVDETAPTAPEEDLLPTLPEGTDLVVIGSEGTPVPLSSEEAAEILYQGGDPIWCPSGVSPNPGVGGCTGTYGGLDLLIADAGFQPTSSGTIWVEWGPNTAGSVIDGFGNWAGAETYALTIQGGWEGNAGSTALHTADPYSYFSGAGDDFLHIRNWIGAVTLKNLVFNSAAYDLPYDYATVDIDTAGNITLTKVEVNNASNIDVTFEAYGAYLDNTSGTGTVNVTNSSFTDNEGSGLRIWSDNTVTLKNVLAYSNGFNGVTVDNTSAATAKVVNVTGSAFEDNGEDGLIVDSNGTITLNYVSANSNGDTGALLQNYYLGTVAAAIYVNGYNTFNGNGEDGVYAYSNGLIKVSNTTAHNNSESGLDLSNEFSFASVGITISGFANASDNGDTGIRIISSGAVAAANVIANNNGNEGLYIENIAWTTPKNVTLTGYNVFNENEREGLFIWSEGTVLLNNLSASENGFTVGSDGVFIDNREDTTKQMGVTLNGYNYFNDNGKHGLEIQSYGVVTLNNITAIENGFDAIDTIGSGADVLNTNGTYVKAVSIKGVNVFDGNEGYGLYVDSDGAISVSKVTANNNKIYGARLYNGGSPGQSNVTISGYGVFEWNNWGTTSGFGLYVNSNGSITTTNLSVNHNYGTGAYLYTRGLTSVHAVTLNGVNNFNFNGDDATDESGLYVYADGNITVNKISASYNSYYGAFLDNYSNWFTNGFAYPGSVYVNGYGFFIGNVNNTGLDVLSHKSITLNRVTANFNGVRGIHAETDAGNVTIVCSSGIGNLTFDLRVDATALTSKLTLKGFLSTDTFFNVGGTVTVTTCP